MPIMRFQFSLATLLVCMTVLAVVAALSVGVPFYMTTWIPDRSFGDSGGFFEISYPITGWEIARRFVLWGTPATAATLGTLWAIRRLKSRRRTEPPGG
jgi:hypothetical protein